MVISADPGPLVRGTEHPAPFARRCASMRPRPAPRHKPRGAKSPPPARTDNPAARAPPRRAEVGPERDKGARCERLGDEWRKFGRGAREGRVGAPEVRRARKAARRKSGVCAGGEGGGGAKGGARPHVGAGRWRAAHRRRPTAAGCRSEHLSTVTRVCRFMIKLACTFWAYRQPRMTAIRYVHGMRARGILTGRAVHGGEGTSIGPRAKCS